jgi:hypothetical protein
MKWQSSFSFLAILAIIISIFSAASQNVGGQTGTISPTHVFPYPEMLVDSSNNVHVLWYQVFNSLEDSGVYYSKISSNGKLMRTGKIIEIEESQGLDNRGFSIFMDPFDFIHVRYGNRYAKIDTDGKVVEQVIPLTEKLLIPGLSVFKYSDDGYTSFSNREVIHSDGFIYSITNPQDELNLMIYDLNGDVLLDKNITTHIPTLTHRILVDNAGNIHIFSKNAQFLLDSYTYYTKVNMTGEVLINTTSIVDQKMYYDTIILNNNQIEISYLYDNGLESSAHLLRLNMNGTILDEHNLLDNQFCRYSTFTIDKNGDYCLIAECQFMEFTFLKLDRDYNTMVNPFVINNLTLTVKGKKCSWFIPVYVAT